MCFGGPQCRDGNTAVRKILAGSGKKYQDLVLQRLIWIKPNKDKLSRQCVYMYDVQNHFYCCKDQERERRYKVDNVCTLEKLVSPTKKLRSCRWQSPFFLRCQFQVLFVFCCFFNIIIIIIINTNLPNLTNNPLHIYLHTTFPNATPAISTKPKL